MTGKLCKESTLSIRALVVTKHTHSLLFLVLIFYFRGVHATRDAVVGEAPTDLRGELWQLSGNWKLSSCDHQDPTSSGGRMEAMTT